MISDTVISQIVRKARKAVDDDGNQQAVIATVRGYGYRFIAEVETVATEPSSPASQRVRSGTPIGRISTTIGVVALVAIALVWLLKSDPARAPEFRTIAIAPEFRIMSSPAPEWMASGLPDMLTATLARPGQLGVAPRAAVSAQLELSDNAEHFRRQLFEQLGTSLYVEAELSGGQDEPWILQITSHHPDGRQTSFKLDGDEPMRLALLAGRQIASDVGLTASFNAEPLFDDNWLNENYFRALEALRQGDAVLAERLLATVLEYQPKHPWARLQMATALNWQGQYQKAAARLEDLVEDSQLAADQPHLHRQAANVLGVSHWYQGDLETAVEHFRIMADSGRRSGHLLDAANGELNIGMAHSTRGEFELAEQHYIEAMTLYTRASYQPGRAHVANALGIQYRRTGHPDQEAIWHEKALEIRRTLGNPRDISESLYNLGLVHADRLDWEQAERLMEEALMMARAMNDPNRALNYAANLGWHYARSGRLTAGRELLLATLDQARDIGYRHAEADSIAFLGALEMLADQPAEALEWFELALEAYAADTFSADRIVAELNRARALIEMAELDQAAIYLEQLAEAPVLSGQPGNRSQLLVLEAKIAQQRHAAEDARDLLAEAITEARRSNSQSRLLTAHLALARFQLEQNETDLALATLEALGPDAEIQPGALALHAEIAVAMGNQEAARELIDEARRRYGERWTTAKRERFNRLLADAN